MSGSNNYTEEEVQARTEQLQAGVVALDRNKVQSAVDLVSGVQDLVYRTLNSDVDSVYALLKLLVNRHVIIASKILSNIDLLERYAPVSRQENPNPDSSKLTRLIELSEKLEVAGAGERDALLTEFSQVTESLAKSSVTAHGVQNSGVSPTYAKEQSVALAAETDFLLGVLADEVPNFLNALSNYSAANLEPLSFENQARKASAVLKKHEGKEDLSDAILDSVVLSSLLSRRVETKRDIEAPKYEGTVTTLPGTAAELYGGTKPFILQEETTAYFVVDGDWSAPGIVTGPQSIAPKSSPLITSTMFEARTDRGTLFTQAAKNGNPAQIQKWFSSSGLDSDSASPQYGTALDDLSNPIIEIPYLKSTVQPSEGMNDFTGGTFVDFIYWDGAAEQTVRCADNGVDGTLIDTALAVAGGHILTPDLPFDGVRTEFTFTGLPGTGSLKPAVGTGVGANQLQIVLSGLVGELWADTTHLEDPENSGYHLLPQTLGNLPASTCSVNFNTGHIKLDLGAYAPVFLNNNVTVNIYHQRIQYGIVDYKSGHLLIKMPFPAAEDRLVSCEYAYHPLALMRSVDTTPGVYPPPLTSFGSINAYTHNDFTSGTLTAPSLTTPHWPPGVPSDWVINSEKLATLIQASGVTAWDFTHAVEGASRRYNFSTSLYGSMSRFSFPNYGKAELNLDPFAPTWTTVPSTINEAIFTLYSAHGERFGADTQFSEITTSGVPVNIACPENTLFTGVPIADVSSDGADILITDLVSYAVEVGDDLRVRWDGTGTSLSRTNKVFHTKILTVNNAGSFVTVYPPLALPLDDALTVGLTTAGTWTCDISRSRIRARSPSTEATSALEIPGDTGLGFSSGDASTGFSSVVELKINLDGFNQRDGYEIHTNDVVLESYTSGSSSIFRSLGRVISTSGSIVTIALAEGVQPEVYPYGSLRIVALGWYRFIKVQEPLNAALLSLEEARGSGELPKSANVFVQSGSGQRQYMSLLYSLKTSMDAVREAYLEYDAHVVKTVDTLLNTLKQERLTLPFDMLTTARFTDIADMTVTEVSEQTSIDNMLLTAFDQLGGETDFLSITHNADAMDDYYSRGTDDKHEVEPSVENIGDIL
tara:strand:+ start:1750 stop:5058 length:3309 start_codon:yes stop_codon:yes gene_type:complete